MENELQTKETKRKINKAESSWTDFVADVGLMLASSVLQGAALAAGGLLITRSFAPSLDQSGTNIVPLRKVS